MTTPVQEYARTLATYTDEQWCRFTFRHEALAGRIDEVERRVLYGGAADCGTREAAALRRRLGDLSVPDTAAALGVPVTLDETQYDGVSSTFATHSTTDGILIYADNARATDALIATEDLGDLTGGLKTEDLLMAHELFHHVENTTPDIYVQRKHVLIFKLGRFEYRSRVMCLSEVAAMAFAKRYTGLPCHPHVFDVLMLYARNPQRAKQQYEMMKRICENEEMT